MGGCRVWGLVPQAMMPFRACVCGGSVFGRQEDLKRFARVLGDKEDPWMEIDEIEHASKQRTARGPSEAADGGTHSWHCCRCPRLQRGVHRPGRQRGKGNSRGSGS